MWARQEIGDKSRLYSEEVIHYSSCDGKGIAEVPWMTKMCGSGLSSDLEWSREKSQVRISSVADKGEDT